MPTMQICPNCMTHFDASFDCFFSTQPSYDSVSRVKNIWVQSLKSRYHLNYTAFPFMGWIDSNLSTAQSMSGFIGGRSHTINFQCFDIVKAILKLDESFEDLERLLNSRDELPKYKILVQYSEFGYNNLDYGEVVS